MTTIARWCGIAFVVFLFVGAGCTDFQKAGLYGKRNDVPQSESVDWPTPIFKLSIVKCFWDGPQLVVVVSMTYSGNDPAVPTLMPLFRLESADGKHYVPSNGGDATMQLMTNNYNPGLSREVRLTFPAPHGDYTLRVENGGTPVYVGIYPTTGVLMYVWHIQPSGG